MAPYVSLTAQRQLSVPTPDVAVQREIGSILGALDARIDSNRRLATLLEQIAQAAFTAQFLNFLDVGGRLPRETGVLPDGWRVVPFSEAVEINPRVDVRKGDVRPFIEMSAVDPWATRPSRLSERPVAGGAKFEPGDTLMARITGCIDHGKGAFTDFIDEAGSGSTEFLVFRAREPLTPEAVFFFSRLPSLRAHAMASMSGSSGRQRVPVSCFDDFKIAVPPDQATCRQTTDLMTSALRQSRGLWREARSLERIRDALLPKLVSGQIRVPETADPEEVVGPVADELVA